jgi:hypothetical protein
MDAAFDPDCATADGRKAMKRPGIMHNIQRIAATCGMALPQHPMSYSENADARHILYRKARAIMSRKI